jgi:hypothetical protein
MWFSSAISETHCELSAVNQVQEAAKESHSRQLSCLRQDSKSNKLIQAFSLWTIPTLLITMSMITTRSRRGNNDLQKIEELRLVNKKMNDEIRKKKAAEEKTKKAEAEKAANLQLTAL